MRLHRSLPLLAAAALLVAGCGSQSGPSAAENTALSAIAHAGKVLSYPIPAKVLAVYMPSSVTAGLGAPAYLFAVSEKGHSKPTWVVAGQTGAHALHVYKNIADLAAHAAEFHLGNGAHALQIIAASKTGTIALPVIGVYVHSATQAQLKKIGVKVGAGSYTIVSLLSAPPALHAANAAVANFVESQGKVVMEYGTTH